MREKGKILLALGSLVLFLACRSSLFSLCVSNVDSIPPCHAKSNTQESLPQDCDCPLSFAEIQKPSNTLLFPIALEPYPTFVTNLNFGIQITSFFHPKRNLYYSDHYYSNQSSIRLLI